MTLHGGDISHYQRGLKIANTDLQFVIPKATDGHHTVDPECDRFYQQAKKANRLRGVYHFAENDGDLIGEADWFLHNVSGYIGDAVLALDWEHGNLGNVSGAKAWLDHVYAKTRVRPLIYMSQSVANGHNWSSVAKDYGLWVARYNDEIGPTGAWKNVVIWQHTDAHKTGGYSVDGDTFYGDAATWAAYATGDRAKPAPTPDGGDDVPTYWHPNKDDPHYHQTQGDPIEEAKVNLKEAHANAVNKPNEKKAAALQKHLQAIRTDPDLPWWEQK